MGNISLIELVEQMRKLLKKDPSDSDTTQRLLKNLEKTTHMEIAAINQFSEQWWQQLKYKNQPKPGDSFLLSDLVLKNESTNLDKWNKHYNPLKAFFNQANGLPADFNFLTLFRVKPEGDGFTVEIETDSLKQVNITTLPTKVVDFRDANASFKDAIRYVFAREALESLAGMIPEPISRGIISYAVSRWFRLYRNQKQAHLHAVLEMINQNQIETSADNAFSFLNAEQEKKAGTYIVNYRTSPWSIVKRLFKNRSMLWHNYFLEDLEIADRSLIKLVDNGHQHQLITPWFASAQKDDNRRIYALAESNATKMPLIAVNYSHPKKEIIHRYTIEVLHAALDIANFTPSGLKTASKVAFSYLFRNNIKRMKRWESRLASHLRSVGGHAEEIEMLNARRLNPFEYSEHESEAVIAENLKSLNLN